MSASDYPSAAAEEQAALWIARLDGGRLAPEDQAALDSWLAADAEHPRALERFRHLSLALDEQLPALAAVGAVASPPPPAAVSVRRRSLFPLALILGGAAAAVALALWLPRRATVENFTTAASERRTISLADGTQVELNAHTSLFMTETRNLRHARLSGGEAFFVVAKDPSRPFVVDTPAGSVRVTGTVFDVRDEDGAQLDVTVVEGSVQVSLLQDSSTYSLVHGDHFSAAHPGIERLSASQIDDLLAWRDGAVVFNGQPLSAALAEYSRYTGNRVSVAPDVADLRVGGRYSFSNGFLAGLERSLHVQVSRDASGTILVTARPRP